MGFSRDGPRADAQVPVLRGGLHRFVHRRRRISHNGAMDSDPYAGVLPVLAGISRFPTLAWKDKARGESGPFCVLIHANRCHALWQTGSNCFNRFSLSSIDIQINAPKMAGKSVSNMLDPA